MKKPILYIDMDGVICNFMGYIQSKLPHIFEPRYAANEKDAAIDAYMQLEPHLFQFLEPMPNAIQSVKKLADYYDVYFLSTPAYDVPMSYTSKRLWLEKYFGELAKKKLILTHRKDLCIGDILIDDRTKNGASEFKGELIIFGESDGKLNWEEICDDLLNRFYNPTKDWLNQKLP